MDTIGGSGDRASSPDYVSLSLASAMVLRLESGRFYRDAWPSCINLLLTYPQTCLASCAYCGLARKRPAAPEGKSFIRVEWPVVPTTVVVERLLRCEEEVNRICLSMVTHPQAYRDTLELVGRLAGCGVAPLSVLVAPNLLDEARLRELRAAGAETIGVGLDAASEYIFDLRRGRRVGGGLRWTTYWRTIEASARLFGPGKVNCHLVVGLGESDADVVSTLLALQTLGVETYLFSFYPEPRSHMAKTRRPSLVRWRRLQLVKHLLETGQVEPQQVHFDDEGRIAGLEAEGSMVEAVVTSGVPFMTDGCPGKDGRLACTRPFGSYRPGERFRDYPFPPDPQDVRQIERQVRLHEVMRPS